MEDPERQTDDEDDRRLRPARYPLRTDNTRASSNNHINRYARTPRARQDPLIPCYFSCWERTVFEPVVAALAAGVGSDAARIAS
jgi:hypothetical protein